MRRNRFVLLSSTLLVLAGCASSDDAYLTSAAVAVHDGDVDIAVFYERLSPHGDWVYVADYGRVWVPGDVYVGWRPYTHGHWVWTVHGWTWYSDWAWGWAGFHYGRWHFHHRHRWVWVPGPVWGPAWVAWRDGDPWVGWAPLPPDARWRRGHGLAAGPWRRHVHDDSWVFLDARYLGDRELRGRYARAKNRDLLRRTRHVTHYRRSDGRLVNDSVSRRVVSRRTGRTPPLQRIREVRSPEQRLEPPTVRREVRIYRPRARTRPHERTGGTRTTPTRTTGTTTPRSRTRASTTATPPVRTTRTRTTRAPTTPTTRTPGARTPVRRR